MKCPLTHKDCLEKECKWWVHLLGENPQSGQMLDKSDCAVNWIPLLLIEVAKEGKASGIAVESMRNETVKVLQGGFITLINGLDKTKQLEDKKDE